MTARAAAKNLIRAYVLGGTSIEHLAAGMLGAANDKYYASIGGYICNEDENGQIYSVRKVGRYQIGVDRLEGKNCNEIFSLKEIYDEILNEATYGVQEKLF